MISVEEARKLTRTHCDNLDELLTIIERRIRAASTAGKYYIYVDFLMKHNTELQQKLKDLGYHIYEPYDFGPTSKTNHITIQWYH